MAVRTTPALVQGILLKDYDAKGAPALDPFILTASVIVDQLTLLTNPTQQELVERWLAAHFYCQPDKPYQSRSSLGASGSFSGQTGQKLESTLYGQTALILDTSGGLASLMNRAVASMTWMGKTESEQVPYYDRMG